MGTPPAIPQITTCATVNQSSLPCLQWPVARSHSLTMWHKSPGPLMGCCGIFVGFWNFTGEKRQPFKVDLSSLIFLRFHCPYWPHCFLVPVYVIMAVPWRLSICLHNVYHSTYKGWWHRTWVLYWKNMKELKHVKNLRLQLSKHIKLLLFLNFFLARTSSPKPKINFSNMFIDPFPFHFPTQSCFAVVSIPERALRPAQSTSRPVETTVFCWFPLSICLEDPFIARKKFSSLGDRIVSFLERILGIEFDNIIFTYLYISLPFCDRIHVFFPSTCSQYSDDHPQQHNIRKNWRTIPENMTLRIQSIDKQSEAHHWSRCCSNDVTPKPACHLVLLLLATASHSVDTTTIQVPELPEKCRLTAMHVSVCDKWIQMKTVPI